MEHRALLDANVLWSPQQRNILLQIALKLDIGVHRTSLIVEEWLRNVDGVQRDQCRNRTIPLMQQHFPSAWLPAMPDTPFGRTDPKDRRVAAAAAHVAPSILVTWNLQDFDETALQSADVVVRTPDGFLCDFHERYADLVREASRDAQANLSRSAPTWDDDLGVLSRSGLHGFVGRLSRGR